VISNFFYLFDIFLGKSTVSKGSNSGIQRIKLSPSCQFINLLTKDENIRIGHDLDSQTVDITTSRYKQDGISVTLVDTPGFDDSREGITDTDILGKIANFLQEK
jgi:hypothetical protein